VSEQARASSYALLTDGTTIEIRPAQPGDFDAVRDMHAGMSPDNLYLRFFGASRVAAEQEARRACREPAPDHGALLALLEGHVVGCATYECARGGQETAEAAMAVSDDMHNRGVGTLLLEHLISLARGRGVRAFIAETLTENALMLKVFADAGLPVHRALADGVYELSFPLPVDEADASLGLYRDAVAERERSADVASLRHVLAPASVAVIGASRRAGSVGRAILANVVDGGFAGPVYAVNPGAAELDGVPCVPSAAALPGPVDLAVIATPAAAVVEVAEDCGRHGVKAVAVVTAELGRPERAKLLRTCRRHGMRLVGPGSFGVASPAIGLNATFAARQPAQGSAGLALQSGVVGVVLLQHLSRLGIGISSFVSLGDKDDVSGNDMLLWWESDQATRLAVLYLESFGNPRKFGRTARAVGRTMPVLTVDVARSAAGRRLLAARATPPRSITRQALFEQAGVIAAANLGELLDATALLACQPVPAGANVAVVANSHGGAVLAADACADAGLRVATLAGHTQRALAGLLPPDAAVAGPVDTTAVMAAGLFRQCLELAGADPGVDAVLALTATTATSDLVPEVATARLSVPVAAAVMDQSEAVRLLPGPDRDHPAVPAYAYPESAARALGHAARYGIWRATPPGRVPDLAGLHQEQARDLVARFLADTPGAGWLARDAVAQLLGCYRVPLADGVAAVTEGAEVTISVLQEKVFGPLILLGTGSDSADRVARLTPLTQSDADDMVRSVRAAGHPSARPALAALTDMLLRVSRLADDLPQVAELDISLVIAGPGGAQATAARIRIRAAEPDDAYLRRLR
jgi:acyl-CoA synthetase (NDP forming)/GNAT superfamily N-acetyltransferase